MTRVSPPIGPPTKVEGALYTAEALMLKTPPLLRVQYTTPPKSQRTSGKNRTPYSS